MHDPKRQKQRDDILVIDENERGLAHLRNHLSRCGRLAQTGVSAEPSRARRLSSASPALPLRYRS